MKEIIEILKSNGTEVKFVEIEWRDFSRSAVPNLTRETYNARRATINRNIKRYCRNKRIHCINTSSINIERVGRDGVHLDNISAARVKKKISSAIVHAAGRV